MRYRYPISSEELKDYIDSIYDMQIYMLGYPEGSGILISGVYDDIESSGINIMSSGYDDIIDFNEYFGKLNYINTYVKRNNNI